MADVGGGTGAVDGLSGALEDYLRTVGDEIQARGVARVRDIARSLNVKAPSVTSALKRLAGLGLIDYAQREYVQLTDEGKREVQRIAARRRVLSWFFEEVLALAPAEATENACAIEHVLSAQAMDRLVSLFEFVRSCPSGRDVFIERYHRCPIVDPDAPACHVACSRKGEHGEARPDGPAVSLADIKAGERGRVIRVEGKGEIRQRLIELGLLPDEVLAVERTGLRGDPVWIRIAGFQVALRRAEARMVIVDRLRGA